MILSVTGHRPDKLGGYHPSIQNKLVTIAICSLKKYNPHLIITGMAIGWDQAIAQACITTNIPFIAAIPFLYQEKKWPVPTQTHYHYLLSHAKSKITINEGNYEAWKMHKRNKWMVDHSDWILALWNNEPNGGTYSTLQYAKSIKKKIINVWNEFQKRENL